MVSDTHVKYSCVHSNSVYFSSMDMFSILYSDVKEKLNLHLEMARSNPDELKRANLTCGLRDGGMAYNQSWVSVSI